MLHDVVEDSDITLEDLRKEGFSDKDVAQISNIVGENVGICVARGDSNNNKIVSNLIE